MILMRIKKKKELKLKKEKGYDPIVLYLDLQLQSRALRPLKSSL